MEDNIVWWEKPIVVDLRGTFNVGRTGGSYWPLQTMRGKQHDHFNIMA